MPVSREKRCDVFLHRKTPERVFQPWPDLDIVRLAAGKEGVHNGRAHCGIVVAAEEVVLSAQGQRPDGILHAVVVDVVSAVKDIAAQSRKEGVCVNQGPSHSGPGSEATGNGVHPFLNVPDDGISLIFSSFPDRIRLESGLFHIGFQLVEFADINYGLTGTLAVLVKCFYKLAPYVHPAAYHSLAGGGPHRLHRPRIRLSG